jgi:DNA topoisomerase-2
MKSDKIQQLSQKEHIFKRSSMYIGDITTYKKHFWLISDDHPFYDEIYFNEGFFKLIQEPIDNSIDEFIKTKGLFGNIISIKIKNINNKLNFIIEDNGRGLSTDKLDGVISAKIAFTSLMSGSNFDDDNRHGIGMNGVGVSLTNLFSEYFDVVTVNEKHVYKLRCENNGDIIDEEIKLNRKKNRGTKISFILDMTKFVGMEHITYQMINNIVKTKLVEIKTLYDDITIYFNGDEILYGLNNYLENGLVYKKDDILFGIYQKKDNESDISFANCVNTYDGGSHLNMMLTFVYDVFRSLIKKKYKIDIKVPALRKEFYFLFSIKNIKNANFIGQYKAKLNISSVDFNNIFKSYEKSFRDFLVKYFTDNEIIFNRIIQESNSSIEQKEINKIIKNEKKRSIKNLEKFIRIERHIKGEGDLFIAEGDSAIGMGLKVRDNRKHAFYAIGGKFINVFNMSELNVRKSSKVNDLLLVLGVDLRDINYVRNFNYKNIYLLVDNDTDGQHIAMLLILFFFKYFPDIIVKGRLKIISAPLVIAKKGNSVIEFYDYSEFVNAKLDRGYDINYYKGLGTYNEDQYRNIIYKPRYKKISLSDITFDYLNKIFSDDAYYRKLWLEGRLNGK